MSGLMHTTVENVIAVETAPGEKRVIAVEWLDHDPMRCDGNHLDIQTDGWLWCPTPGCRWQYDPEAKCPVHGKRGDA